MKKQLKIAFYLTALACVIGGCSKRNELIEEKKIQGNHKNLASAVDGLYDLLGYGYDVTGEYANSDAAKFSVINVSKLKTDYFDRVETDLSSRKYGEVLGGENAVSYLSKITNKVGASASIPEGEIPKTSPSDGKNLPIPLFKLSVNKSFESSDSFNSKYVYSSYNLFLKQKRLKINADVELLKQYLQPSFVVDIQSSTPQQIVANYGTHVLKDIILGAKLSIKYRAETNASDRTNASTTGLDINVFGIFGINTSQTTTTQQTSNNTNWKLVFETIGGEPSASLSGSATAGLAPSISTVAWENSSSEANAELIDFSENGLIPIWELIPDAVKAQAVKTYVMQYLLNNQVVITPDPVYVFYNNSFNHYTTADVNAVNGYANWTSQGIDFKAFSSPVNGAVPVYVFYNGPHFNHYTTANINAVNGYPSWTSQGISFYAYPTQKPGTVPIYVYYRTSGKNNHYTTSNPNLTSQFSGWTKMGVSFYAYPAN